ncbi:MAG TPA: Bax inhibitor-1/YccA family protein [Candidatus Gastranaerophilaceae bacterium]|nr:Bax inhibitor-1/YccA family protein [Candidatus Gastranaerophilaceae bacterium]
MTNPVFNQNAIDRERVLDSEPMTVNGAINKTFILFCLLLLSSLVVWDMFFKGYTDKVALLTMVGFISSIIAFIVIMFNRNALPIAAPVYAASEGLLLGGISAYIDKAYPGIAIQAVGLTLMALFSMLALYRVGAIRCTDKFRSVLFISTLSIAGIYLVNFIGSFFGMHIPQIFTSSNFGIGFSIVVVAIASLNLIIDFDFIEQGAQNLLSKNFEWYGAFGLMVTLVWLYIEILNLLAKLRDR